MFQSKDSKIDEEEFQKCLKKPLVQYSDMPSEMGNEAVEVIFASSIEIDIKLSDLRTHPLCCLFHYRLPSCLWTSLRPLVIGRGLLL